MNRFWVWLGCLLLGAGCAGTIKPHMAPPAMLAALPPGKGVVVGSFVQAVTLRYEHNNYVSFSNQSRRTYRVISMQHRKGDRSFDIIDGDEAADLFAFVLPEGVYALDNASTSSDYARYETGPLPEVEFTVSAGEILYLGEIYFGFDFDKKEVGYQLEFRNKWDRDIALFKARYPGVDWSKARINR